MHKYIWRLIFLVIAKKWFLKIEHLQARVFQFIFLAYFNVFKNYEFLPPLSI